MGNSFKTACVGGVYFGVGRRALSVRITSLYIECFDNQLGVNFHHKFIYKDRVYSEQVHR